MADYIIANGESLYWHGDFKYNDTILVQTGGSLGDVSIPRDVASVIAARERFDKSADFKAFTALLYAGVTF